MAKSAKGSGGGPEKKRKPKAKSKAGEKRPRAGKARAKSASKPARPRKGARPRTGARPRKAPTQSPGKARAAAGAAKAARAPAEPPRLGADLSEEEAIRSAKYLPRELPRLFEEERFIFPESYGVDRVRLLVKDPDWLFAHWDVNPGSFDRLRGEVGERSLALARLTLRVSDPVNGGSTDILLAPGARSWYVRTDSAPRSYKAELGLTLPSGAFRRLAESNVVVAPRTGPSAKRAQRRMSFGQAREAAAGGVDEGHPATEGIGPLSAPSFDAAKEDPSPTAGRESSRGGASDVFRPGGASDVHRR